MERNKGHFSQFCLDDLETADESCPSLLLAEPSTVDHLSKPRVRGPAGGAGWLQWRAKHARLLLGAGVPDQDWWVASIDVAENEEASESVGVRMTDPFTEQADQVTIEVGKLLGEETMDAILRVAGGWAGGNAKSKSLFKNCDLMWKQSMWTSTISATWPPAPPGRRPPDLGGCQGLLGRGSGDDRLRHGQGRCPSALPEPRGEEQLHAAPAASSRCSPLPSTPR